MHRQAKHPGTQNKNKSILKIPGYILFLKKKENIFHGIERPWAPKHLGGWITFELENSRLFFFFQDKGFFRRIEHLEMKLYGGVK